MSYIHSQDILHRDLKTENILSDEQFHPKISDFGLSIQIPENSIGMTFEKSQICGTPACIAPEIWKENKYSKASDVYAFAFIVYEIMTNKKPLTDFDNAQILYSVAIKGHRPKINKTVPKSYKKLIENCWNENPSKRPSFSDIISRIKEDKGFITSDTDRIELQEFNDLIFKDEQHKNELEHLLDGLLKQMQCLSDGVKQMQLNYEDRRQHQFENVKFKYENKLHKNEVLQLKIEDELHRNENVKHKYEDLKLENEDELHKNEVLKLKNVFGLFTFDNSFHNMNNEIDICRYPDKNSKLQIDHEGEINHNKIPDKNSKLQIDHEGEINHNKISDKNDKPQIDHEGEINHNKIPIEDSKEPNENSQSNVLIDNLIEEARIGNLKAMIKLGEIYYKGENVLVDKEKAKEYYKKAADLGNTDAMNNYGWILIEENGFGGDISEAKAYLEKAVNKGNMRAMKNYVKLNLELEKLENDFSH